MQELVNMRRAFIFTLSLVLAVLDPLAARTLADNALLSVSSRCIDATRC